MNRRIVITGWGLVTSLSCDVDDCWNRILAGESGVHPFACLIPRTSKSKSAATSMIGMPARHSGSKESNKLDRYTQFALIAAEDAIKSAGFESVAGQQHRYGVVLGSGIGGMTTFSEQMEKLITKGPSRVSPLTIPKLMLNAGGGNIAIKYGFRGPNFSVATACASATNAMGNALDLIRNNVVMWWLPADQRPR